MKNNRTRGDEQAAEDEQRAKVKAALPTGTVLRAALPFPRNKDDAGPQPTGMREFHSFSVSNV